MPSTRKSDQSDFDDVSLAFSYVTVSDCWISSFPLTLVGLSSVNSADNYERVRSPHSSLILAQRCPLKAIHLHHQMQPHPCTLIPAYSSSTADEVSAHKPPLGNPPDTGILQCDSTWCWAAQTPSLIEIQIVYAALLYH